MLDLYMKRDKSEKLIICNEGSSRSSKTFDGFHFLVMYCDHNRGKEKDVFVFRDTLVNCRDFTIKDFKQCLGREGMGIYEEDNYIDSPKPYYKLWGTKINFRGLDKESEASRSDLLYFNELLECEKESFDSWVMRNENLVIADWNPKYSDHWAFKLEKLPNCKFTRTTYKNNKHLSEKVVKGIERYSPWMLEDMKLPEDKRRPHEENIRTGTADKYRWMVYGMGLRANKEGLVFPNVTYVDAIPDDVDQVSYGMDFGKTAQTAIVKCAVRLRQPKNDLFLQNLFYAPTENSDIINQVLDRLGIGKNKSYIHCDNNLPGWILDLRSKGKDVYPTTKFPGSREYWITSIKKFNIHIVRNNDFRTEQENFCYRVVDGKQLSETIKAYDHLWSASGYSVVGDFRELIDKPTDKK